MQILTFGCPDLRKFTEWYTVTCFRRKEGKRPSWTCSLIVTGNYCCTLTAPCMFGLRRQTQTSISCIRAAAETKLVRVYYMYHQSMPLLKLYYTVSYETTALVFIYGFTTHMVCCLSGLEPSPETGLSTSHPGGRGHTLPIPLQPLPSCQCRYSLPRTSAVQHQNTAPWETSRLQANKKSRIDIATSRICLRRQ